MDPTDTRLRLLEAALHLTWPRSYGAVSVEMICKEAGVFKGSCYHFFPSKADLVAAALEHYWQTNQPRFDRIFGPPASPLEQIRNFFEDAGKRQHERRLRYGRVVGCPYSCIGSEVSLQEPVIGDKIRDLVARYCSYFERALRAANESGALRVDRPEAKARELFAFLAGTLTQARIHDDLTMLDGIAERALALLNIHEREAA